MPAQYSTRLTAFSFYALAVAFFISVSLLSIYHILTLAAFLLLLSKGQINFKKLPNSSWALLAFIVFQTLSAIVNFAELEEKSRAFGSVKYPLIGILSILIFQNELIENDSFLRKHARIAFNIFLATIPVAFIYGFTKSYYKLDLLTGLTPEYYSPRVGGFTDVMRYGYGSALVLLVLLTVLINPKVFTNLKRSFLASAFVVGFTGMYLSYTRGSMLGFLLGLPVIIYYFNKKVAKYVTMFCLVIISIMVIYALVGENQTSRFLKKLNNESDRARLSQYQSAIYAVKENPVFGLGPGQLKFHVKEIKERYDLEHKQYAEHAHNAFLEVAASSGIIGIILYLSWIILWTKELFVAKNTLARQVFLPVILFVIIAGQFEMLLMAQTSSLIYFLYALSHFKVFEKRNL